MKKLSIITITVAAMLCWSCDLTEVQQATPDRAMVFGSEAGLELYCNSFYSMLPGTDSAFKQDNIADHSAKSTLGIYESGAYTVETSTSWSWSNIRNVNYFIKYNVSSSVDKAVRDNYTAIARLFRAYLYFDKLVIYGEVPWYDTLLEPDDARLYAPRDTRDKIIENIIADLDFAYANIVETKPTPNANRVNKWTALLLKSRVCLFEASWRRYHAGSDYVVNCSISAENLYELAAEAAKTVMDESPYSLHNSKKAYANGRGSYRELFISDVCPADEVMLAVSTDKVLGMGEQNWWYNSSSFGQHLCMARPFALTYLNADGTVYNEKSADGSYKTFAEETTGRDLRLNQTIRAKDYTCKNASGNYVAAAANFTGHTLTGYQYTKYVMDDVAYDDGRTNDNDIPIMRFAEALLNYAEAKAELGTLTDDDWKTTIGALRRRAGITGGDLDSKPTVVDPYLQRTFYPDVTNPAILEIRRERAIELCLEGFRLKDLKRWACGGLWQTLEWTGIYIPALEQPLDINGDGTNDAFFTTDTAYKGEYKGIAVPISGGQEVRRLDDDPNNGYLYVYNDPSRTWRENMYLYPIPAQVIAKNEALTQNPGWETPVAP